MEKTALITGISGQDGYYLTEFLTRKVYRIIGISRNKFTNPDSEIMWIEADMNDDASIEMIIQQYQPNEVYNLASLSSPGESWRHPVQATLTNALAAQNLFEAVKKHKPDCRIFQASSSEMYGDFKESPQNEDTLFNPINPYAASKVYAHQLANLYRKAYQLYISCGILFNHESPRRGMHFITQKVTYAAACLKAGITHSSQLNEKGDPIVNHGKLSLGCLDAQKDWGYAGDYVEAMWLCLQHATPDDYVIGTGRLHSIEQLCDIAFTHAGLNWKDYVEVDKQLSRPMNTGPACANASKAKHMLGWEPKKTFSGMITEMVDSHYKNLLLAKPA